MGNNLHRLHSCAEGSYYSCSIPALYLVVNYLQYISTKLDLLHSCNWHHIETSVHHYWVLGWWCVLAQLCCKRSGTAGERGQDNSSSRLLFPNNSTGMSYYYIKNILY